MVDRKHAMRGTAASTPEQWIELWNGCRAPAPSSA